jgi:hypothetical protein
MVVTIMMLMNFKLVLLGDAAVSKSSRVERSKPFSPYSLY